MRRFQYFEPQSLDEAVSLLGQYGSQASILAGGTDLLVEIKEHLRTPDFVINIKKLAGLNTLHFDPVQGLTIGALVTVREVETNPIVNEKYAGLAQACRELGSIQIRNRATVAGNICHASPSADTLPPLIARDATVKLFGPDGERSLPIGDFFTGPGQTRMGGDEILVEIAVPPPPPRTGNVYIKHGRRQAMELATAGVAITLTLENDRCHQVRIVLGAVAPTPIRALEAEMILRGSHRELETIEAAAEAAMNQSRPISDVRSSAAYRREMVRVLASRAIKRAFDLAAKE